eukprot:13770-Heterococcus_DN1.PRE.3
MSQTKFVLGKALAAGLKPVVVINKVDRESARMNGEVENELFDLFVNLGATDSQLDYPTLYASGRVGWATPSVEQALAWSASPPTGLNMGALLDTVVDYIPPPCSSAALEEPLAIAINNIGTDTFLGALTTGIIESGTVEVGTMAKWLSRDGTASGEPARVGQVFITRGTTKEPLGCVAGAGDIVTVAGIGGATPPLAPPTLSMTFGANDGPLSGGEGVYLTASAIKSRLEKECENNVTIRVAKCATDSDKVDVFGRGEMQLGILIESMRREGYEFVVSPPRILMSSGEKGVVMEPIEEVTVDVDAEYSGMIIDSVARNSSVFCVVQQSLRCCVSCDKKLRFAVYDSFVVHEPKRSFIPLLRELDLTLRCAYAKAERHKYRIADTVCMHAFANRLTSNRKGALLEIKESGQGKTRLQFHVPSRGLLGFGPEARSQTHGSAIINSTFR